MKHSDTDRLAWIFYSLQRDKNPSSFDVLLAILRLPVSVFVEHDMAELTLDRFREALDAQMDGEQRKSPRPG